MIKTIHLNKHEGSGNNLKQNETLILFILGDLFNDRKETLASLMKTLNDNFFKSKS